jgi:hypothetical protein
MYTLPQATSLATHLMAALELAPCARIGNTEWLLTLRSNRKKLCEAPAWRGLQGETMNSSVRIASKTAVKSCTTW